MSNFLILQGRKLTGLSAGTSSREFSSFGMTLMDIFLRRSDEAAHLISN